MSECRWGVTDKKSGKINASGREAQGAAFPVGPLDQESTRGGQKDLRGDASSEQCTPHQKHGKLGANADKSLVYPKGIFLSDVLELKPAIQAGASLLKT